MKEAAAEIAAANCLVRGQGMEYCYGYEEFLNKLPRRSRDSYKGTYGRVLVIAGSKGMCGAAYLAGKAAYRSGAGLVFLYTQECNRVILQQLLPEAVLVTYDEEKWDGATLDAMLASADAVVAGPGLGKGETQIQIIRRVLSANDKKRILDADALNILSGNPGLWQLAEAPFVITPHMGEMQRLSGVSLEGLQADKAAAAREFSRSHSVITVLKDARTIVSDGGEDYYRNSTGNHGMATGGSGDVLSGVIGGMMAQGMDLFEAAKLGVYIHGMAGDTAREKRGAYSMMAGDIAEYILYGVD